MGRTVQLRKLLLLAVLCCADGALFFFWPAADTACADEVAGYVRFTSFQTETRTTTAERTDRTETDGFLQQYGLTLNKRLYPKLYLIADGVIEKNRLAVNRDGAETDTTITRYRPTFDLTLRDPLYTVGANYSKQQVKTEVTGVSPTTLMNEQYAAILSWKPSDLPLIDARWTRNSIFDKEHVVQDTVNDLFFIRTRYQPLGGLDLRYQYTYEEATDRIEDAETQTHANAGKISYDAGLFDNRVRFYTGYEMIRRETELTKRGAGEVSVQVFAFSGLSSFNDTPTIGTLGANAALVNNDTAGATGITLGLPQATAGARNVGLDFGIETAVDALALWVAWNNTSLPSEIAAVFSWDVYTSMDNENWTYLATAFPAIFDQARNRFEIRFPAVVTRYVKIVVNPLTPAQAQASPVFSNASDQQIFVTELQAFSTAPATAEPVTTTTKIGNVVVRALLLDDPALTYDFSYVTHVSEGISERRRSTLANALSVSRRFSDVYSGAARVGREDSRDTEDETTAYVYSATLYAFPIRTVSNVLTYSGRSEKTDGQESTRHSLFMHNTAALYRGVDAFLSGGTSYQRIDTGKKTTGETLLAGASITPRRNLTITPNHSYTRSESDDNGEPETVTRTRREELSVTYIPFPTIYAAASWTLQIQGHRNDRLQNYSFTWSPFAGSALQFTTSYRETAHSADNTTSRLLSEAARWNITSRTYLMASLFELHADSNQQDSRTSGVSFEFSHSF